MNAMKVIQTALGLGFALLGSAQAALIDRGGGLIYDTDLNVTWLQDARYAHSTGYTADGVYISPNYPNLSQTMLWQAAYTWAHTLSYYDTVRGVTYSDWRLPKAFLPNPTEPTCFGGNCVNSELGHLWYVELGNVYMNGAMTGRNSGPFLNTDYLIWAWTETIDYGPYAYSFHWTGGDVTLDQRWLTYNTAWAVRDGDVARTQSIPEPATAMLTAIALAGLALLERRRYGLVRKLARRT